MIALPANPEYRELFIKRPSWKRFIYASALYEAGRVKIRGREILFAGYSIDGSGKRLKDLHVYYVVLK